MSTLDFDAWLGEAVEVDGKEVVLPKRVVDALNEAWDKDVLDEDDVPIAAMDDAQLDAAAAVFKAAFDDGALLLKVKVMSTDVLKLERWLRARFTDGEVVGFGAGTASKVHLTDEFKADLAQQGMTKPIDLFGFELSMYLGRAVSPVREAQLDGTLNTYLVGTDDERADLLTKAIPKEDRKHRLFRNAILNIENALDN